MKPGKAQQLLIGAVVAGGAAALVAVWKSAPPAIDRFTIARILVLTALTVVAELVSIRLPHGATSEQITLGEVAIAADVAMLPAAIAPLVAIAGLTISLVIRKRPAFKIAYNAGQYALATVIAASFFHLIGPGGFGTSLGLAALFLGMIAFAGSNLLTISAVIATATGRRMKTVAREEVRLSLAVAIGNSTVGIVGVALWFSRPILVLAMLGPAFALYLAHRGWVRQIEFVREIADQKEKLERIVAHSSEGIVLADGSGRVVIWSPSMERISGLGAAEAEGKPIGYLLHGRSGVGAGVKVEVGGEDAEFQAMRADGADRWLKVRHGPVRDEDGTIRWDVLVVNDMTTEHDTEKMKERFLATVSHELRTPLTPIIGYAKFLLRHEDVDVKARRDALASLLERSEHMQRLVEDLLLASSVDKAGSVRVHARKEPVDVADVVTRGVVSARVSHPNREIVLEGDGPVLAIGDRVRIMQVLANLIDNAVKYSAPETPVVVRVGREGLRAAISVTDRGKGIPTDKQRVILDKFRRLENPDRMETGGAGLGLFIVDQLVRAMGGTVFVDSKPGRGSTFTVRLDSLSGQAASPPQVVDRSA